MKFSSLSALEIVKLTTFHADSDKIGQNDILFQSMSLYDCNFAVGNINLISLLGISI